MLKPLLEDNIRVMIYAGDLDLICNWVGNQMWVDALQWEGGESWASVAAVEWTAGTAAAGSVRELGPLSFVRVYKAGHMVPMDQPLNALAMISRFTRGQSLASQSPRPSLQQALEAMAKSKQQQQQQGEERIKELPTGDRVKALLGRRQVTYPRDRA